jgi:hypothetical protein
LKFKFILDLNGLIVFFLGMIKKLLCLTSILSLLAGCATNPNKIAASYVSPLTYKDYDNDQIVMEMDHVGRRSAELYHSLKKEHQKDSGQMAVGLLLFWPALFFLEGGDGPEAAEYARLKGQYEALRTLAVQRKIGVEMLPPSPEDVVKQLASTESAEDNKRKR